MWAVSAGAIVGEGGEADEGGFEGGGGVFEVERKGLRVERSESLKLLKASGVLTAKVEGTGRE